MDIEPKKTAALPPDSCRWNKAMIGAFRKGMTAHQSGQPLESCPYQDKRKSDGRLSWSRAFIAAWRDGWRWSANSNHRSDR